MAASIGIRTNLAQVVGNVTRALQKLQNPEYLLRPIASNLIVVIHDRIHEDGKAADGGQIGLYSDEYMKVRQDLLPAKITRGPRKGQPREKYNRSSDRKVIVSLTRQLENDYAVIATPKGYGIGFNNSFNAKKARWVEETKNRVIYQLTADEKRIAQEIAAELVNQAFIEVS